MKEKHWLRMQNVRVFEDILFQLQYSKHLYVVGIFINITQKSPAKYYILENVKVLPGRTRRCYTTMNLHFRTYSFRIC